MKDIHDLASLVGYDALDNEFLSWLESDRVLSRRALGVVKNNYPDLLSDSDKQRDIAERLQAAHRLAHPDGPWGFEFCARCNIGSP